MCGMPSCPDSLTTGRDRRTQAWAALASWLAGLHPGRLAPVVAAGRAPHPVGVHDPLAGWAADRRAAEECVRAAHRTDVPAPGERERALCAVMPQVTAHGSGWVRH